MATPLAYRSEAEQVALSGALVEPDKSSVWTEQEWDSRARLAVEERLAPVFFRRLSDRGLFESVPLRPAQVLRRDYYNVAALNLLHFQELSRVLGAVTAKPFRETVPARVIVLKGAALASDLYGGTALRPMSDIDLLVPTEDLDGWVSRMANIGYKDAIPAMREDLERSARFQIALCGGPKGQVVFEIHRSIVAGEGDWRAPAMEWFWDQTRPLKEEGYSAEQFNTTANMAYLSAHAMLQHGAAQARLIWLYDIHLLLTERSEDIDWQQLRRACERFGWLGGLRAAFDRCRDLFGTEIPGAGHSLFSGVAAPGRPEQESLLSVKADVNATRAQGVWREIICLDWRERFRMVRAIVWPTPRYLKWRYPSLGRLWPLGYPYRWWLVFSEGLTSLTLKRRRAASRSGPVERG